MRKTIMLVVGALAAIFGFVLPAIGVAGSNLPGAIAAVGVVLSYVFFEAKKDAGDIVNGMSQLKKWTDPAFWTGLAGSLLVYFNGELGLNLPVELITSVLIVVIPFLIKLFHKSEPDPVLRAKIAARIRV